jgi:hypothetical protein
MVSKIQFTAGKIAKTGKIVEVLGVTPKGISVCYEVFSDRVYKSHKYLPLNTEFVWVREFKFKT